MMSNQKIPCSRDDSELVPDGYFVECQYQAYNCGDCQPDNTCTAERPCQNGVVKEYFDPNDPRPLHECTQCGKRMYPVKGMLSCDCEIAKPWKFIWTDGWAKAYQEARRELRLEEGWE